MGRCGKWARAETAAMGSARRWGKERQMREEERAGFSSEKLPCHLHLALISDLGKESS